MQRAIHGQIHQALSNMDFSDVERRFNVKINIVGGGSYDPSMGGVGTFKVEASPIVNGEAKTSGQQDFERCAPLYGFDAEDFGKEFMSRGRRFKIVGWVSRRPKYPISAECLDDGKAYKFTDSSVLLALGKKPQKSVIPRHLLGR